MVHPAPSQQKAILRRKKPEPPPPPVGGMWFSPHLPPPFFPTDICLNMIAIKPISAEKLHFPAVSGGNNASLPQIRNLSLESTVVVRETIHFLAK